MTRDEAEKYIGKRVTARAFYVPSLTVEGTLDHHAVSGLPSIVVEDCGARHMVVMGTISLVDAVAAASVIDAEYPVASRDFPHRCPRCGRAAYVGFLRVEHEGGGGCL